MPFPKVFGLPDETSTETSTEVLRQIRADIITSLAGAINIPPNIIRPFFLADRLGDPDPGQDNTIYCELGSGMFGNKPESERKKATSAVAEVIWRAFRGKFEVEVYIDDLYGAGKTLCKPALKEFTFRGYTQAVTYVKTEDEDEVGVGVQCDIYLFNEDESKDLAIITVKPGHKTPLQRVKKGDLTVESHISGKGTFTLVRSNGITTEKYNVSDGQTKYLINVRIGDQMQWEADPDSYLVISEVCFPPYEDGRYENLVEESG